MTSRCPLSIRRASRSATLVALLAGLGSALGCQRLDADEAAAPAAPAEQGARRHASPSAANWPQFRGPQASGISSDTGLPLTWSATSNIVWKTPLPGRGASSPIVWDDKVYVTAYSGYGLVNDDPHRNLGRLVRHLFCISRDDGQVLWQADRPAGNDPPEHPIVQFLDLHGYASSTPVADETGVYAYFGTHGVVAYAHDGKLKWEKQIGWRYHNWGSASSPVLFEDLVIVHADIEEGALVAFDKRTGREEWKVPTGDGDSWSTPLVVQSARGPELVFHHSVGEPARLEAVDPRDGTSRWHSGVLQNYLCPSPIAGDGVIYVLGYQRAAAIRAGGRGEVQPLWEIGLGSEVCTPVLHDGHLYWPSENEGIAYCVDAATGAEVYRERLEPRPGLIYASGVAGDGRIYYVSREEGTYVVPAEPRFELLAHNTIESDDSIFNGTPAISRGQLLLRSDRFLYCIGGL
jgi:outer membrane protein assembly factor BamB